MRTFRTLAREPDRSGAELLLDGIHLVREAWQLGLTLPVVAVSAGEIGRETEIGRFARDLDAAGTDVIAADAPALAAMSPTRTPSGCLAIARRTPTDLDAVFRHPRALIVAAADIQDPGNVGALVRAAEALGATALLTCGHSATPFAWKALRGSMGSALRLPLVAGLDGTAAADAFHAAGIRQVATMPGAAADPECVDWSGRVAIWLGAEGAGLDPAVMARCDARVSIPMCAPVESLNVAVAGALLLDAARRQRLASTSVPAAHRPTEAAARTGTSS